MGILMFISLNLPMHSLLRAPVAIAMHRTTAITTDSQTHSPSFTHIHCRPYLPSHRRIWLATHTSPARSIELLTAAPSAARTHRAMYAATYRSTPSRTFPPPHRRTYLQRCRPTYVLTHLPTDRHPHLAMHPPNFRPSDLYPDRLILRRMPVPLDLSTVFLTDVPTYAFTHGSIDRPTRRPLYLPN